MRRIARIPAHGRAQGRIQVCEFDPVELPLIFDPAQLARLDHGETVVTPNALFRDLDAAGAMPEARHD